MTDILLACAARAGLPVRHVYLVLSPRSLPYARCALKSLFRNSLEALDFRLITDSESDREELVQAIEELNPPRLHRWRVLQQQDLADQEASLFATHANLRSFRQGHPCWRKITDPLLLSGAGEELILLDPDVYFPNPFRFEETPPQGLLLMWQKPNCLLPAEVVRAAMNNHIPLARHVDIGVAHWRASADLDWLDWLVGRLGGAAIPRVMHVEAIVWAAIAMRGGGGYLDPLYWRCWRRTLLKRVMRKCGISGTRILQSEPWQSIKCFHAGGEAKWWLNDTSLRVIQAARVECVRPGVVTPFIELDRKQYVREQTFKNLLHRLGYHRFLGGG